MKAIVTGSTRGLGLAISKKFKEEGIDVAISSRNIEGLNKALDELNSVESNSTAIGDVVDFGEKESVSVYVKSIVEKLGGIDILVNNVGTYFEDRADSDIEDNLEKILEVNLMSSVRMNKMVVELMKKQKSGFIFNVISIVAKNVRADAATYSISKLALKGYNDLLRESLKKYGIRVIALYPGAMNTSSWDESDIDRSNLIQMSDMTSSIYNVLSMSKNASIEEIVINTIGDI